VGDVHQAHLGAIAATDFLTAEILTFHGLVRVHVLFVMDVATRRVEIAGITSNPNGAWMQQVARNLVDGEEGFLKWKRYLIMDRDALFTTEFRRVVEAAGVKAVRLPPRSPNLNAFAERFVLSIKSECLDRILPLGEGHLRKAVTQFVDHYHRERNHQGIGNQLLMPASAPANGNWSRPPSRALGWPAQLLLPGGGVDRCLDRVSAPDGVPCPRAQQVATSATAC
jgi:transposase InsO family protein